MRDGWEVLYALNPNFDDSQEDTDNDGWDHDQSGLLENTESYTNIEEYVGKDGGAPFSQLQTAYSFPMVPLLPVIIRTHKIQIQMVTVFLMVARRTWLRVYFWWQ